MCLFPVQINKPNSMAGLGSLSGIKFEGSVYSKLFGYHRSQMIVPCGKCTECLKRRQNDLATRAMREAAKRGSMHFLTLTYDNQYLPLQVRLERVDKESGEIFHDMPAREDTDYHR